MKLKTMVNYIIHISNSKKSTVLDLSTKQLEGSFPWYQV